MRKIRKNQAGFTLVELIVVFAMISIFMTSATLLLKSAMSIYHRTESMTKAQVVADTVLTTVLGEVSASSNAKIPSSISSSPAACFIKSGDPYDTLYFFDKDLNFVRLGVERGIVVFHYMEEDSDTSWHWFLGDDAYLNNQISRLKFVPLENPDVAGENINVIRATMAIENKQTGFRFVVSKIINCYNLPDGVIIKG